MLHPEIYQAMADVLVENHPDLAARINKLLEQGEPPEKILQFVEGVASSPTALIVGLVQAFLTVRTGQTFDEL